jgi:tetratricopeptide (TPR) repeat protein
MKPLPLVLVCVLLSVGAGLLVRGIGQQPQAAAAPQAPMAVGHDPERVERLEQALEEQQRALEGLRREFAMRIEGLARREVQADTELAAEVETPADAAATGSPTEHRLKTPEERTAEEWLALLNSPEFTGMERESLWLQIARAGRTRELVALFEQRAERDPYDPALQVELGSAYLRMVQEVGQGPLAGQWAGRADEAFDRALELDPEHVEARLNKAIALSFWPPIFGKQADAVKQFETLIGQLEGKPLNADHAQAWLLLGNLHQQQGQQDKALEIWQNGAALFPNDPTFAAKLGQ